MSYGMSLEKEGENILREVKGYPLDLFKDDFSNSNWDVSYQWDTMVY